MLLAGGEVLVGSQFGWCGLWIGVVADGSWLGWCSWWGGWCLGGGVVGAWVVG